MFVPLVLAANENCRLSEYTNSTVPRSYCAMVALLTKRGFQNYVDFNAHFADAFLTQISLPDIALKVMQFQLSLKNI